MKKLVLIVAVVAGAGVLLLGGCVLLLVGVAGKREVTQAERNFQEASGQITAHKEQVAFGNSPRAVDIAKAVSDDLKKARTDLFKGGKRGKFSLSDGEFLTYCELQASYCAILVHVPELRQYDKEAKEIQGDIAWEIALGQMHDRFPEQDFELAVGLRGSILYGPIRIGKTQADEDPKSFDGKSEKLHRFFVRPGDKK
jgi:hypothetical protein